MYLSESRFSLGVCSGMGLLDQIAVLYLFFKEPPYCSLQRLCQCTFPPIVEEGSLFSTPSPAFIVFSLLQDGHSDRCPGWGDPSSFENCSSHRWESLVIISLIMMSELSTILCVLWLSVCLLWRNIYLDLLPIF